MIDEVKLHEKIAELLDVFFTKRKESLGNLKLLNTLIRKNPYLYRAAGVADASEIVEEAKANAKTHTTALDQSAFISPSKRGCAANHPLAQAAHPP